MSTIRLIHGSCADQEADAVVNAANRYLAAGGGICGVIFSRAGYAALQDACEQYALPLQDGDAVVTPAFGLQNAKCIIHAVGPNFSKTPGAVDALFQAYCNCFLRLRENGLHSISFPLLSAGIFSGNLQQPAAVSAGECVKAYRAFVAQNPDYDITVMLCAYSQAQYQEVKACLTIDTD